MAELITIFLVIREPPQGNLVARELGKPILSALAGLEADQVLLVCVRVLAPYRPQQGRQLPVAEAVPPARQPCREPNDLRPFRPSAAIDHRPKVQPANDSGVHRAPRAPDGIRSAGETHEALSRTSPPGTVRRERLRQDARHLPGRQYNHPVREPPLAAAPVPEISDRQVWSYRRAQVTAPVSARPGEA
jgi:hypothetical protein